MLNTVNMGKIGIQVEIVTNFLYVIVYTLKVRVLNL